MDTGEAGDKEVTIEDVEEEAKKTEQQLDLLMWKIDGDSQTGNGSELTVSSQDECVLHLLKSVNEVRADYASLRAELAAVQALQRELAGRLRAQLGAVRGSFAGLRERLRAAAPPRAR